MTLEGRGEVQPWTPMGETISILLDCKAKILEEIIRGISVDRGSENYGYSQMQPAACFK